jgi:hypothetical protein
MWEEIKRYLAVLVSHLSEQKDLFIHKLIIVNFSKNRDASYTRIGENFFKAYKDGKITEVHDENIAVELDMLFRAEEELETARQEMDDIRNIHEERRKAILGGRYGAWQRAAGSYPFSSTVGERVSSAAKSGEVGLKREK